MIYLCIFAPINEENYEQSPLSKFIEAPTVEQAALTLGYYCDQGKPTTLEEWTSPDRIFAIDEFISINAPADQIQQFVKRITSNTGSVVEHEIQLYKYSNLPQDFLDKCNG